MTHLSDKDARMMELLQSSVWPKRLIAERTGLSEATLYTLLRPANSRAKRKLPTPKRETLTILRGFLREIHTDIGGIL